VGQHSAHIQSLLDRIADILARGEQPPSALLHELTHRWKEERPDDIDGLGALLVALRANVNHDTLAEAKRRIERARLKSTLDVHEWRQSAATRSALHLPPTTDQQAGWLYPVFFGTTRAPSNEYSLSDRFGVQRGQEVIFGRCTVWVPATHLFATTGTPWWQRWLRLQLADDHLQLHDITTFTAEGLWEAVRTEMGKAHQPHGLVYLHGYHVTFEDAAIRAAQMGFDLKVNGATAFFSWPSKGSLTGYAADAASLEASEDAIAHFLMDFVHRSGAQVVHIIAHSMGNRGLLRALQRLMRDGDLASDITFGQIFLAAPDVDRDVFLNHANLFPRFSTRTTLYASDADHALATSAWLYENSRAGYCPPVTVPRLARFDTVRVPRFNLDLLGHSYYAEAGALLYDMSVLMSHDTPPAQRPAVLPVEDYWVMQS
jgi:esterase/lipase superfamily enzyme